MKDVCIHSLRYTFASRLFDLGYSVPEVQKLTGHKNTAVLLEVCSKALDERKREAANALSEGKGDQDGTGDREPGHNRESKVAVSA